MLTSNAVDSSDAVVQMCSNYICICRLVWQENLQGDWMLKLGQMGMLYKLARRDVVGIAPIVFPRISGCCNDNQLLEVLAWKTPIEI